MSRPGPHGGCVLCLGRRWPPNGGHHESWVSALAALDDGRVLVAARGITLFRLTVDG
jgi:hypothetical protein